MLIILQALTRIHIKDKVLTPLPKGYNRLLIVFACLIIVYTVHEYPEKVNTFFFTLLVEIITYIATIWIYRGFKELP